MVFRNLLWWFFYAAAAIWLQVRLPGLDAFIPGVLLSLQERRWQQTCWVILCVLAIQEGAGTLAFGAGLLWYGALVLLFVTGRCFFVTTSLIFVVLLAVGMGGAHALILYTLSSLQHLPISLTRLVEQSLAQALLIPPLWGAAYLTRNRFIRHADAV